MTGNHSRRFEHLRAGHDALRSRRQARSAMERLLSRDSSSDRARGWRPEERSGRRQKRLHIPSCVTTRCGGTPASSR